MTTMMTNPMRQGLWVVVLGLALAAGLPARAAEQVGAVAALEGRADALRQGGDWTALAAGDPVMLGDRLRTAAAAKLKILFRDESVLTLAASSEMTVDEQVAGAAPKSSFSLLVGTVRAVVTDAYGASGSHFEVETPTAIAGVRGTGFIANYDATKDETVVVGLFDTTTVRARTDARALHAVVLGPGQATAVKRGALPLTPSPMAENLLRNLTEGTNIPAGAPAEKGLGRGAGANAEPRVPKRPGAAAQSQEGRVVDQPIGVYEQKGGAGKPPPPPPPPPR